MNEREFAGKVAIHLSTAARELDDELARRLRAARERALDVQRQPSWLSRLSFAGGLQFSFPQPARSAAAMVAVLVMVVAADYRATWTRVAKLQEVDTALLIDDLPIDAYLDTGFKEWLARESQS